MAQTPSEGGRRLELACRGDGEALGLLLEQYRDRFRRMVELRIDPRLRGRIDASDVIQEGYIDAARRIGEYARAPGTSFYVWLRFLVGQRLMEQHRRHLGGKMRDAGREVPLHWTPPPAAGAAMLAAQLMGKLTSPSHAAIRAERRARLHEALERMDPLDREALVLRHYEQMTTAEVGQVLGVDKSTASRRYARAIRRLKEILEGTPGGRASETGP